MSAKFVSITEMPTAFYYPDLVASQCMDQRPVRTCLCNTKRKLKFKKKLELSSVSQHWSTAHVSTESLKIT
jgi:hypothetical protein